MFTLFTRCAPRRAVCTGALEALAVAVDAEEARAEKKARRKRASRKKTVME